MPREPRNRQVVLVVDRIACDGHGLCAELLPERIELDDWGYPIVTPGPIPDHLLEHAERAVAFCPVLALRLRALPQAEAAVNRPVAQPLQVRRIS
jgi:ferredoxin